MNEQNRTRIEHDSLGEVEVPEDALYGAQTQRAVRNFRISGLRLPWPFIEAICLVKSAAARVNRELGTLDAPIADAIERASETVRQGHMKDQFPIDVFQTGSGTSTNMNVNEVLATLASRSLGLSVHPNDHVNFGQSSNDVIPTAIQLSALLELRRHLVPALTRLIDAVDVQADRHADVVKTGRTHLMDAMPVTLGQELSGWSAQLRSCRRRIEGAMPGLCALPQGGTAVGTGINAPAGFAARVAERLATLTGLPLVPAENTFERLAAQDHAVELSGQLRVLAVCLMKIANDLRWMNSGPDAGLGEIELPALQPGSSIMPGKVNPVGPEAVAMVAAAVMGSDVSVGIAGQSGNFELNVMLPLIAHTLLQNIEWLANASALLTDGAIAGFRVNHERIAQGVAANPILITALNPLIGYAKAAEIAKAAYRERRPIIDVAAEQTDIPRAELERLLDPARLTRPEPDA